MLDLLLVNMPIVEGNDQVPGIYYIKSAAEAKGFSATAKDLNAWFKMQNIDLQLITNYFMQHNLVLIDRDCEAHNLAKEYIETYVNENIETFKQAKYIGVSLFSVYNIFAAVIFVEIMRSKFPAAQIILGGSGTEDTGPNSQNIGQYFLNNDMADFVVYGEGEQAIQNILLGKNHIGIPQVNDLNSIPYPDYSDFFKDFPNTNVNQLTVIGSRGCVRKCTFCNVPKLWPSYKFRSGQNISEELIHNYEKYGINNYGFGDSLINGSMKAFRDLCSVMAKYHKDNPNSKMMWSGQFICKSKRQMPFEDFTLMKEAGCVSVDIGVESGSEKVRNDIKKGFTEEDMHHTLESLLENGIQVRLLFLVGYPTETEEDFQKTLDMVARYAKWKNLMYVTVGKTLRMLDNTELHDDLAHLFYYDQNKYTDWVSTVVPDLNFEKRVERARAFRKHLLNLGYNVLKIEDDENFFIDRLSKRT